MALNTLQLISSIGFFGAENVVIQLSRALQELGVNNTIGVFDNGRGVHMELVRRAASENLHTAVFPCTGRLSLDTVRLLRRYVLQHDINIVHTHNSKANAYGFLSARLSKRAIVATCHNRIGNAIVTQKSGYLDRLLARHYYLLDRVIMPWFHRVCAVSDTVSRDLLHEGLNRNRLTTVKNGLDIRLFAGIEKSGRRSPSSPVSATPTIIGSVARFTEEKGLSQLIQATARLLEAGKELCLVLVGDGPLKETLQQQVEDLGISKQVRFPGFQRDMREIYSSMDVFVLPSLVEGLPMALLEAMASGLPVVSTRVGEVPSVVEDKKEGILVVPGNAAALAEAIEYMLIHPDRAHAMACAARERVASTFSSKTMAAQYVAVYRKVLSMSHMCPA